MAAYKKTIGVFFQYLPPYPSAVSLRGKAFIDALTPTAVKEKCNILIFTTTPNPIGFTGHTLETIKGPDANTSHTVYKRLISEIALGFRVANSIRRNRAEIDLLVLSSPSYVAVLVIIFHLVLFGIKYVIDVRDIYPQAFAEASLVSRGSIIYKVFTFLSRRAYHGASVILTATQGLATEIRRVAPHKRVVCVYNGFPKSIMNLIVVKHSRFTLCFHGVLGFFQDIETLVEIAIRLEKNNIDMVVIGCGRKEGIVKKFASSNLKMMGELRFEDTINEIAKCHLGLCLRRDDNISKDSFPVKVFECLGLGIPVIVTPFCEAGEFIERNRCGFQLNAGDVESIVDTILRLRNNIEMYSECVDNCINVRSLVIRENLVLDAAKIILDVV